MSTKRSGAYHFIVTIPDRLYPFRCRIEGQWVRGMRSYDRALADAFRRYGPGHYGYGLALYRSLFHILGSLFLLYAGTFVALRAFGSTTALLVLLAFVTFFITYQEFILQRREYRQRWTKGILDWCSWCAPIALYVFFLS